MHDEEKKELQLLKEALEKGQITEDEYYKAYKDIEKRVGWRVIAEKGAYRLPKKILRQYRRRSIRKIRQEVETRKRDMILKTLLENEQKEKEGENTNDQQS